MIVLTRNRYKNHMKTWQPPSFLHVLLGPLSPVHEGVTSEVSCTRALGEGPDRGPTGVEVVPWLVLGRRDQPSHPAARSALGPGAAPPARSWPPPHVSSPPAGPQEPWPPLCPHLAPLPTSFLLFLFGITSPKVHFERNRFSSCLKMQFGFSF